MSARNRRRVRVTTAVGLFVITAVVLGPVLVFHTNRQVDAVQTIDDLAGVLSSSSSADIHNYLLVGSDSRAGSDPTEPDFGGIGGEGAPTGQRADTIMVLRVDEGAGAASLLSLPRDLYLPIPDSGRSNRINAAFARSEATLVRTVQESLGIPVHHYLEVDFEGFKDMVDAVGGVEICFLHPARDGNTGLDIPDAGCRVLDGIQALQFARSRYFEQFVDGEWRIDGTADLGRIKRQQLFVTEALDRVLHRAGSDPLASGRFVDAAVESLRVDPSLELVDMARSLGPLANEIVTYQVPVRGETIGGAAVLTLADGADAVLDYFRGVGERPVPDL
jgi:LCP family protein required for cell wall assembly